MGNFNSSRVFTSTVGVSEGERAAGGTDEGCQLGNVYRLRLGLLNGLNRSVASSS